jgi:hypothetical protein
MCLGKEKDVRRYLLVVALAAVMLIGSAGAAFAGEVKGPPGDDPTMHNLNVTGALDHANSICAASGLNDYDQARGQNESQVQTAADSWKHEGLPKGSVGTLGLCKGGTN